MSLTEFFKRLGAPLKNSRWSWGAQRPRDGAIFLRVWEDRKLTANGREYMLIDRHSDDTNTTRNLGYQERRTHIQAVRAGRPCYLVMCIARDVNARARSVERFLDQDVCVGGPLLEKDGDVWIEVVGRKRVSTVLEGKAGENTP
jgi:hypothetical protein